MTDLVEAFDIRKSYGQLDALKGVSLKVSEGSITGLIGPDGAGKSTLMKIFLTLLKRDSGDMSVLSSDPDRDKRTIRENTGYMPEIFSLYTDLTVEENMDFYFTVHKMNRKEFSSKKERMYRFSRLEPFSSTRAGNLSGGMKQKLALSCALMHDPRLLILDEPTTGVDPLSRQEFWGMLHELKDQGVTILVSTPYMEEALKCDYIYLMHKGAILGEGIPGELPDSFKGRVYEFGAEGKNPQEFLSEVKDEFKGNPVYISGRKVHLAESGNTRIEDIQDRIRLLSVDLKVSRIVPDLEDIFVIRVMEETAE